MLLGTAFFAFHADPAAAWTWVVYVGNDVVELVVEVPQDLKARVIKRDGTAIKRMTEKTPQLYADTAVSRGTTHSYQVCNISEGWFGEEIEWCGSVAAPSRKTMSP